MRMYPIVVPFTLIFSLNAMQLEQRNRPVVINEVNTVNRW
jgi:hypothetical protein